ncbi:hypothetical protein Poli38472_005503 [Pythium oligandrum]|uniref:Uncharacterized protein n=1 Tax=Pythium oligandrum TaxID=41045 RepID=A0A8K1CHM6_PYTOL|nr:hypothetical protein Poli38472_005503 [Pythium oligandrum]|eukprot:TMW62885.1 hypothetical protein Poli38472_005503 [Pythium oligandrum]
MDVTRILEAVCGPAADNNQQLRHAFVEKLCLSLDATEVEGSAQLSTLEFVHKLLGWDAAASELKRSTKTQFQEWRWKALSVIIAHEGGTDGVDEMTLLAAMRNDRFASIEVLRRLADLLVVAVDRGLLTDVEGTVGLIKQLYVTLEDAESRKQLAKAMETLLRTKDHVKTTIRMGLLRSIFQVAIGTFIRESNAAQDDGEGQDTTLSSVSVLKSCAQVLQHVGSLVCIKFQVFQRPASDDTAVILSLLSESVVQLMLSRVLVVFEEAVRLLQMLVDHNVTRTSLIAVIDLRGALEKARILASRPDDKPTLEDEYIRTLCVQLHASLIPEIDAFERVHGSLMGLPNEQDGVEAKQALDIATLCKTRGNEFFQRGNFGAARLFYRRAISILRGSEFQETQRLASLSKEEFARQCTVGASVLVVQRNGSVRSAMVSDVEEGDDDVEVLYDDSEDEERVALTRIRLRPDTQLLEQFKTLSVDCIMNMGKAFVQMYDYESGVACFSDALKHHPQYIAALYHRGVAYMATHDLKGAQQDLWNANQLCRQWKTTGNPVEAKKKKVLHGQVVAAYKRLQVLHANKKKVDKKLIKQMMQYLSTIPGLQDDDQIEA